jgi:hypothetical protein
MHYIATDDFCKIKAFYSISIYFSKFGLRFILVTLYILHHPSRHWD